MIGNNHGSQTQRPKSKQKKNIIDEQKGEAHPIVMSMQTNIERALDSLEQMKQ